MQRLESEISFLRSDLPKKIKKINFVKSLVTSHMFREKFRFYYENVGKIPRTSSKKMIVTTKFCSSGHVSEIDDVIYEQVPTKSKDQADSLNAFSVSDDSRNNNKKVNIQQRDIFNNI